MTDMCHWAWLFWVAVIAAIGMFMWLYWPT